MKTSIHADDWLRARSRLSEDSVPDKTSQRSVQPLPQQVLRFLLPRLWTDLIAAPCVLQSVWLAGMCSMSVMQTAACSPTCPTESTGLKVAFWTALQCPRFGTPNNRRQQPVSPGSISSLGGDSDAWPQSPHSPRHSFDARSVSAGACMPPWGYCKEVSSHAPSHTACLQSCACGMQQARLHTSSAAAHEVATMQVL